jgi:hypothetical protein
VNPAISERYGPYAIVAGGSEGVGAAFAWQLAAAGINLVLISRDAAKLEAIAGEIAAAHAIDVRTLALDLSRADMLDAVKAATADIEVGLLVCTVGATFGGGAFVDTALDDLLRTMRLNSIAQISLSHHFGGSMAARGRGGIVLIGSLAGNAGSASMVIYGAGKAFAQNFAEGLWAELEPRGVDILYVVLGATDTPVRARLGLVDPPGLILADPTDVAREALAHLGDGPVLVPAHLEDGFRMFSSLPRRQAAEAMRDLLGGFSPE